MAKPHYVFGKRNSSKIISEIIENYLNDNESINFKVFNQLNQFNYSKTLNMII